MAIIIRNLGGNPLGTCDYEVRVNERVMAHFSHDRGDGLTTCLRKAAEAIERKVWSDMASLIDTNDNNVW